MSRTVTTDPRWLAKVDAARENTARHPSSARLLALLWAEGFGPVAAARMLDWWRSCHPEVIAAAAGSSGKEGKP